MAAFKRSAAELALALHRTTSWELSRLVGVDTTVEHFAAAFRLPCLAGVDDKLLYASVCSAALEALQDPELQQQPPLAPGESRSFTARQCCGILANAMLGNVHDLISKRRRGGTLKPRCPGGLSFVQHMRFSDGVHLHKTAALLVYFEARRQAAGTDDARAVTFEYIVCPGDGWFEALLAERGDERLAGGAAGGRECTLHPEVMEAPAADAFVNFANKQFGYGCFIPSCTQEEILQMCCPEFNVGMLLLGTMRDDEVVNVRGCRRYSRYTGYLDTYECVGAWPADTVTTILTLDACTSRHFSNRMLHRDVRKACASFARLAAANDRSDAAAPAADGAARPATAPVVSTGRWGCGVFGGVPAHKFLQQMVAASLAGVTLRFSTFGSADGCDTLLETVQHTGMSAREAWELLRACDSKAAFEQQLAALWARAPPSSAPARGGAGAAAASGGLGV